jgi:hypothetical protein
MRRARIQMTMVLGVMLAALLAVGAPPDPKKKETKAKVPCAKSLAACPEEGCGGDFDPELNKRKNIRASDAEPTPHTLAWMKKLDDPENFTHGDTREELADLGEGKMIRVVAYLLTAKAELGGESCNCGLQTAEATDNHLVLVTKQTVDKFPIGATESANKKVFHSRELESITAEFTPRTRLDHPNFTREKMEPLIAKTPQKALLVRVTGLLLFDSEHFLRNPLVRLSNWEIHPVTKMEFCTTGTKCTVAGDAGWKSVDY